MSSSFHFTHLYATDSRQPWRRGTSLLFAANLGLSASIQDLGEGIVLVIKGVVTEEEIRSKIPNLPLFKLEHSPTPQGDFLYIKRPPLVGRVTVLSQRDS
jgi:hypothetical protein